MIYTRWFKRRVLAVCAVVAMLCLAVASIIIVKVIATFCGGQRAMGDKKTESLDYTSHR